MDMHAPQLTRLTQRAHTYFLDRLGVGMEALLAPVDAALPSGRAQRGTSVYSAIEKARRRDDVSLPRGPWDRELKRADWTTVTAVALDVLRHKSKDLQLAGWLLEAQLHQHGFDALAPCLLLIDSLCQRYWDSLHPQADDGDMEFRTNILRWLADKLLPPLRMLPVAGDGRDAYYCLADWETATRNEQMRAALAKDSDEPPGGVPPEQLQAALHATSAEACVALQEAVADALTALALLTGTLDRHLGNAGPGFGKMADLLERILSLMNGELLQRGIHLPLYGLAAQGAAAPVASAAPSDAAAATPAAPALPDTSIDAIRDRGDAYARLAELAEYLCRIEPHSPAPYLLKRAIEWSRMNTADLYQELFIRLGGTLNIFELLGLETGVAEDRK